MAFLASQVTCRTLQDASMYERHEEWMSRYGKVYKDPWEREKRFRIFKENMNYIETSKNAAIKPYKLVINQFADLNNEEFIAPQNIFKGMIICRLLSRAVTPVKDQGHCGFCWAFYDVASTEGILALTAGKLISLSEQELVDCDTKGVDQGCEEDVPANNEKALQKVVANQPVSIAIDACDSDFQFYKRGVFTGSCGTELDHGVTIVGYGVSHDGTQYWLVKNSWETEWVYI
ncbi:hypothetical protein GYH30_033535 [Glycine max]|uniref:Uncharacterized protein n=2 Tax=Glycine subgen. Soja TaxID=1462606 RepID=K7LUF0_SOYBN|nr:hypothetical protein GYH30_033535 [Glycine max]RZB75562.1 Senescence-specific cysteine protease SAG39 [Glycine soja]